MCVRAFAHVSAARGWQHLPLLSSSLWGRQATNSTLKLGHSFSQPLACCNFRSNVFFSNWKDLPSLLTPSSGSKITKNCLGYGDCLLYLSMPIDPAAMLLASSSRIQWVSGRPDNRELGFNFSENFTVLESVFEA